MSRSCFRTSNRRPRAVQLPESGAVVPGGKQVQARNGRPGNNRRKDMQDSNDKKQHSYSQRIADKLKNIYGTHMQSSEKPNMNEEVSMDEPVKANQADSGDEVQILMEQLKKAEAERDEFREHAVRKVAELE